MKPFTIKQVLLVVFVSIAFHSALAQVEDRDRYYYHDSIKIIGVIYSNDLCLLTNLQYRGNSYGPHERSVAISMKDINSLDNLNDSIITELVRREQAYIHINHCPLLLEEINDLCEENDSIYVPNRYHSIPDIVKTNSSPSHRAHIIYNPIQIDNLYSYQKFDTPCFLLIETTYRTCRERTPIAFWEDHYVRDFWLEDTSDQPVIVILPLSCNCNEEIDSHTSDIR